MPKPASALPIVIKLHPRDRLYHPAERRYVALDELRAWATQGVKFVIIDSETKKDVTRVVLG